MTVLVPTSLDDALASLGDDPTSVVLAGGTDLMVEVNEGIRGAGTGGRARTRSPSCGRSGATGDVLVLGAGLTYTELMEPDARGGGAGPGPGRPHRRIAADPQRRHHRRQPRHRVAGRRHAARARARSTRSSSWPAGTRRRTRAARPIDDVPHRSEATSARSRASSSSRCTCPCGAVPRSTSRSAPATRW